MEHLLEEYLIFWDANMRGFVFGFLHVAIMLLGYWVIILYI